MGWVCSGLVWPGHSALHYRLLALTARMAPNAAMIMNACSKTRGMGAGRKLRVHRREERSVTRLSLLALPSNA